MSGLGKVPATFINIEGQRFGRLVVLRRAESPRKYKAWWFCQCDCGGSKDVSGESLRSGRTSSCGCLRLDVVTKHGLCRTIDPSPEYRAWRNMHERCSSATHHAYPRYGGRGIYVCDEWREFDTFFADVGPRPTRNHSIERIDNSGPYSPANCRWATRLEQSNNKRSNVWIELDGERLTIAQWGRRLGVSTNAIGHMRKRLGNEAAIRFYLSRAA